jgi:hypothetical protein
MPSMVDRTKGSDSTFLNYLCSSVASTKNYRYPGGKVGKRARSSYRHLLSFIRFWVDFDHIASAASDTGGGIGIADNIPT